MCLVRVDIDDGPTKKVFIEAYEKNHKIYFKIEGEYYPARIIEMELLNNEKDVKLMGITPTGRFIASYCFRKKRGSLITKYGIIRDDV